MDAESELGGRFFLLGIPTILAILIHRLRVRLAAIVRVIVVEVCHVKLKSKVSLVSHDDGAWRIAGQT